MKPEKTIVIKKEDDIAFGWFFMFVGVGSIAIIGIMLYGLFFDNQGGKRIDDYLTMLIPLSIASFIIFQTALWRVNGKDIINFYPDHLTIQSKGAIYHLRPKMFRYDSHLRVEKLEKDSLGIEKNRLTIKGLDGHRKFGQGLKGNRLNLISNQLNKLIQERKNKNIA